MVAGEWQHLQRTEHSSRASCLFSSTSLVFRIVSRVLPLFILPFHSRRLCPVVPKSNTSDVLTDLGSDLDKKSMRECKTRSIGSNIRWYRRVILMELACRAHERTSIFIHLFIIEAGTSTLQRLHALHALCSASPTLGCWWRDALTN